MTWEFILGFGIALFVMLIGFLGSILPGLPGTPLVFAAAVLHRLYFGNQGASTWVLVSLALLMILSIAIDLAAGLLGAKKLGATWRGMTGAGLGALIGIFFAPVGIILGPFLGAFIGELAGGRETREAGKAGAGAMLGLLGGALGKVVCCIMMISLFAFDLVIRRFLN